MPTFYASQDNRGYFPVGLVDEKAVADTDATVESETVRNRSAAAWVLVRTENADANAETTVTLETSFDGSTWSAVGDAVVVTANDETIVARAPLGSHVRVTADVADVDTGGVVTDIHVSAHLL